MSRNGRFEANLTALSVRARAARALREYAQIIKRPLLLTILRTPSLLLPKHSHWIPALQFLMRAPAFFAGVAVSASS